MDVFTSPDVLFWVVLVIAVVLIIVGLVKKVLWLCVMAGVIAAILGISQPSVVDNISSSISSFWGGAIEPMEDDDYVDLIGDEATIPNNGFGDIGKNED